MTRAEAVRVRTRLIACDYRCEICGRRWAKEIFDCCLLCRRCRKVMERVLIKEGPALSLSKVLEVLTEDGLGAGGKM